MPTITAKKPSLINLTREISAGGTRSEIINGLSAPVKSIPSKFFYDESGSWLFQQITRLEEYYLTRTEKSILKAHASTIIREMPGTNIIELGSGDCSKISILLNASMSAGKKKIHYFPYEMNPASIKESASWIMKIFPYVEVQGVVADIANQFYAIPQVPERLICFFGSTIGNFGWDQSVQFLKNLEGMMHKGEQLIVGFDMVKDKTILERAYNDGQGITSSFNKNILYVVNNILGTEIDPENFIHVAFYNEDESRIEMHLEATRRTEIMSPYLKGKIIIEAGERIHTENSRKYSREDLYSLSELSGLAIMNIYTDPDDWFSVVRFTA